MGLFTKFCTCQTLSVLSVDSYIYHRNVKLTESDSDTPNPKRLPITHDTIVSFRCHDFWRLKHPADSARGRVLGASVALSLYLFTRFLQVPHLILLRLYPQFVQRKIINGNFVCMELPEWMPVTSRRQKVS